MYPAKFWVAPLLTLAVLVSADPAAAAAVERFVDDQGRVHITNLGAPPPAVKKSQDAKPPNNASPPEPEPPPVEESPPPMPEAPAPPPPPESEQPHESEAAPPRPIRRIVDRFGAIHLTNVPEAQTLAAATSKRPRRAALSGASGTLTPEASATPGLNRRQGHPVARYQDSQGTVHITTAAARMQENLLHLAGYRWPERLSRESAATTTVAARAAKGMPRDLVKRIVVAAASAPGDNRAAASGQGKGIKQFRDRKGTLHIVSAPRCKSRAEPVLPAAAGPPGGPPFPATAPLLTTTPVNVPLYNGGQTGVSVRRDPKGRLLIVNAPRAPSWQPGAGMPPVREAVRPITLKAAQTYGLPVSLVEAVIKVESNFTPHAVSPKGALGLMQLMPGTARDLGVQNPFCPRENIFGGTRYLRMLLNLFNQDLILALAAYNAGFQRIIDCGFQVPPIKETQGFVRQVLGHYYLRQNLSPPRGQATLSSG
jgi:hypothetical protein